MRYAGFLLRLIVLAAFWWSAAIVIDYANWGISYKTQLIEGLRPYESATILFVVAVVVIAGIALSERVLRLRVSFGEQDNAKSTPRKAEAIEPEALRLRDMIALLDEDDLDDLRAEVRETLRERIHRLSADEPETFEALLSDSKRKRR
jgi:flagellar biosynthesis/type III secretory pathway M-ring protein FliF/YscJ